MTENIEKIRKEAIEEIKEKARKNPKILSPFNKGRLEYQKKLKFVSGNEFTNWMQQNGIMKNPTNVERMVHENIAKKYGYDNWNGYMISIMNEYRERLNERLKVWNWNKGISSPMEYNENCSSYLGVHIFERILASIFEEPKRMPYGNPGFDWICKRGYKIQDKAACIIRGSWTYSIKYNNIADYFMLGAFDNREDKNLLHLLLIHKDEIIRDRKMWRRDCLCITNKSKYIAYFKKYEIVDKLDKFNQHCNK